MISRCSRLDGRSLSILFLRFNIGIMESLIINLQLSILFLRFPPEKGVASGEEAILSILFLRFWEEAKRRTRDELRSFNSLFEIREAAVGEEVEEAEGAFQFSF